MSNTPTLPKGYTPPSDDSLLKRCVKDKIFFGMIFSLIAAIVLMGMLHGLGIINWEKMIWLFGVTSALWLLVGGIAAYFIRMLKQQKSSGLETTIKVLTILGILMVVLFLFSVSARYVLADLNGRNEFLYEGWGYWNNTDQNPKPSEEPYRIAFNQLWIISTWLALGFTLATIASIAYGVKTKRFE